MNSQAQLASTEAQGDLFGLPATDIRPVARKRPLANVYDWQSAFERKVTASAQSDMLQATNTAPVITTYKSGACNRSDVLGYIQSGSAIGVCVMDTSKPVRAILGQYATDNGKIFVDSGAFRAFMAQQKDPTAPDIDFDTVLELYHDIIDASHAPANLLVVAPDCVGLQQRSYDLLVEYKRELNLLYHKGVQIMVPMQKGELSVSDHYRRCAALLPFDFVAGLPSNAEALSPAEVREFMRECQPPAAHFLGCSERDVLHMCLHDSPNTVLSCDATQLRKHLGKGRLMTEMQQQILSDSLTHIIDGQSLTHIGIDERFDETDFLGYLSLELERFSNAQRKALCKAFDCSPRSLYQAVESDELWTFLSEHSFGQPERVLQQFFMEACAKQISPKVRSHVVAQLAQSNVI
ncbi:hypothetical protein [Alteromonas gilva]|uniref:Uncharacterized protein n=1 Tax=Alteromonas gilva TaxID=2987522 RepID=A0ABT5L701_9ALTE|nr:hypothetical protein [Alteromonas gilva]MDC8832825.1 hypothetical protein [Alteromonas gilva]